MDAKGGRKEKELTGEEVLDREEGRGEEGEGEDGEDEVGRERPLLVVFQSGHGDRGVDGCGDGRRFSTFRRSKGKGPGYRVFRLICLFDLVE
jgi:hypothetical protein